MKVVIVDIDGTLANCSHREHHAKEKDWDKFYSLISKDEAVEPIVDLVKLLADTKMVLLLTGRPEKYRNETVAWLRRHDIPYHALLMRPDKNYQRDAVLKLNLFDEFCNSVKDVTPGDISIDFVLEDRDQMVRAWRDRGVCCLQVKDGAY